MKSWALFFALFVFAVPMHAAQSSPDKPPTLISGSAVVADLKGDITIHSPEGASIQPQRGTVLPAGSSIETGKGSILLGLADGSQVLVKSHTRLQLKAPETSGGNFLQLLLGNIVAKVQKRLGMEPSFRMGTPTAVITVRGTRFLVEVDKKQKTYVDVYEGLVEVTSLSAPGSPVMVRPGFTTRVGEQGVPDNPKSMHEDGGESEMRGPGPRQSGQGESSTSGNNSSGAREGSGERPD